MQKIIRPALFICITLAVLFILRTAFPKNAVVLTCLFGGLLLDVYLWKLIRNKIRSHSPLTITLITFIFWIPYTILIFSVIAGFIIPLVDWNQTLKAYVPSFILITLFSKLFPIAGLLFSDILGATIYVTRRLFKPSGDKPNSFKRNHAIIIVSGILGVIMFLLLLSGMLFWQFAFRIREQTIELKELPVAFDGIRIVQLSDIHLGSWPSESQLEKAVKMVNNLQPDLIVVTGDLFNYRTEDGRKFLPILKKLHAERGIFSILGNHDYGDYIRWPSQEAKQKNKEELVNYFHQLGWHLLMNENIILKTGSDSIALIGVENWGLNRRFQRFGDIQKAQSGTEGMNIRILLSHDPTHWDSIISQQYQDIDITLSGHTHGGQFGIDCCGIHWSPVGWIYTEWCGLYANPYSPSPQYLYVNQGLGSIGFSGRVGILPEITLLTLKKGK